MRVLIVEDDDLVRRSLEAVLRADGHQTCWARTGEAAVGLLQSEPDLDLVILDVQLVPGGMSGWDVARYKREHPPTAAIPVIVVSGLSSVDIHRGATTNVLEGALILLGKPVDPYTLRSAVESVAEGRKCAGVPGLAAAEDPGGEAVQDHAHQGVGEPDLGGAR